MKVYRIYFYNYIRSIKWVYIKAETEQEAIRVFNSIMCNKFTIDSISEAKEHQIVRSDITLNFTIDFEKDYVCG